MKMTKLEQLIKELCPNGVGYKKLSDIATVARGVRVVRDQLAETGDIPVYQNSIKPLGYHDKSNVKGYSAFVIGAGAAGEIGFSDVDFWAADDCYYFLCPDNLNNRYLYFVLMKNQPLILSRVRKASIPRLSRTVIENLVIPVPPMEVQAEIVKILDEYSTSVTALQQELEKELTARKKQYEYYRDLLLDFGVHGGGASDCEWRTLGDVIVSLNTGLNPRKFFQLNTDDAENYYITIREIRNGKIIPTDKTDRLNDEALRLCNNRSNLEVGDVLFSGTGTIGETAVITEKPTNWNIKEGVYTIKPIQNIILPFFLHYLLQTEYIKSTYMKKVAGGTVKSIPMAEMKKLLIPIPSIEEQKRIIGLLDRFDKLCNDISEGLPAEIEARRKQYEYYRDKLLSFEEVKV